NSVTHPLTHRRRLSRRYVRRTRSGPGLIMTNSSPGLFVAVQFTQATVGVEQRWRQCPRQAFRLLQREAEFRRAAASEYRQAAAHRHDLAACSPLRPIRPRADALVEVEEERHHLADVAPVAGVVGLHHEQPAWDQGTVDEGEERWRDQTAM